MTNEPIIINDKKALVELCLRNAIRYARGEIKYTRNLHDQLLYAYENTDPMTKEVMKTVFQLIESEDQ